jgi:hypothetical protein
MKHSAPSVDEWGIDTVTQQVRVSALAERPVVRFHPVSFYVEICKWLKQADCKSVPSGFVGSNPSLYILWPTILGKLDARGYVGFVELPGKIGRQLWQ